MRLVSKETAAKYADCRSRLNAFEDVAAYVREESEQALCLNAFVSYFQSLDGDHPEEKTLPELMALFDSRPYQEMEITAQRAVDYVTDIKRHWDRYEEVAERMLTDEASRHVLTQLLIARLTLDVTRMGKITYPHKDEYFDPSFFRFAPGGVYVDCGGYTGDTVLQYILTCPDYEKIHMLEPSHSVMLRAQSRLEAFSADGSVAFHEAAAGDSERDVFFEENQQSGDGAVSVSRTSVRVRQTTLDALVEGRVSMIKMDIEGMELPALKGAEQTIRRWHPDLAICVYHKPRDLWELIGYIDGLGCDYEYDLRHHGGAHFFDTVLLCRSKTPRHHAEGDFAALRESRLRTLQSICAIYDEEKNAFSIELENYRTWLLQNTAKLLGSINGYQGSISKLQGVEAELRAQDAKRVEQIEKLNQDWLEKLQVRDGQIRERDERIAGINQEWLAQLHAKDALIREKDEAIQKREEEIRQKDDRLLAADKELLSAQKALNETNEQLIEAEQRVVESEEKLQKAERAVELFERNMEKVEAEAQVIYRKCAEIAAQRQKQVRDAERRLEAREVEYRAEKEKTLTMLHERNLAYLELVGETNQQRAQVDQLRRQSAEEAQQQARLQAEIGSLQAQLGQLQAQYNLIIHSGTFRIMAPVRKLLRVLRRGR